MTAYTVYEPPKPSPSDQEWAEDLQFIKDGFSWGAALAPPIWFLFKGEWRGLLGYLVLVAIVASVIDASKHAEEFQVLVYALNIIVGFEAYNIYRWSRSRAGWREIAAVSGRNLDECERRFFASWSGERPFGPTGPARSSWLSGAKADAVAVAAHRLRGLRARLHSRFAAKS